MRRPYARNLLYEGCSRREFLAAALLAVPANALSGSTLVHEHILVDFIGAGQIRPGRYEPDEVFRIALVKLKEVQALGCVRLHECTPNYLGRDPGLIQRLAGASGIDIRTNTGLYAAANHKYLPQFAFEETAEQLARRWIGEFQRGIDGLKPSFIKIGVNKGPLPEIDRKIVRAANLASRETGLTIASHTGDGKAALEQLELVEDPARFVWVHAQNEKDHAIHQKVARAGAWVEFDGVSDKCSGWHRECVEFMQSNGLLGRTLISQDSGWYHVGEPGGGDYRAYTYLYTGFLPLFPARTQAALIVENPRAAFDR